MANSASARKRIRSTARKHEDNRRVRSSVRTVVAKARRAIEGGSEESGSEELLRAAVSALDRAAERGVIHRRNAARRKSRLMARRPESQAVAAGPTAKAKPAARGTHRRPAAKKPAVATKARRTTTKTERTAATQRRSAGSTAKKAKPD